MLVDTSISKHFILLKITLLILILLPGLSSGQEKADLVLLNGKIYINHNCTEYLPDSIILFRAFDWWIGDSRSEEYIF